MTINELVTYAQQLTNLKFKHHGAFIEARNPKTNINKFYLTDSQADLNYVAKELKVLNG